MEIGSDTTPEVAALQAEALNRMSAGQRLGLALELSDLARGLALAGIRHQNPEWTEVDVRREWVRRVLLPEPLPPLPRWLLETR